MSKVRPQREILTLVFKKKFKLVNRKTISEAEMKAAIEEVK